MVTRDTCSAPRILIPTNAIVKSSVEKTRYTPKAYHPYDLMRCFNRCERVAFGPGAWSSGGGGEEGEEGELERKGV